jgi:hypothetical protein
MLEITANTDVLKQMIRENPAKVDRALRAVALNTQSNIALSFGTSPAGRSYKRGKRVHVASQPGYPPNVDTGALRASLRVTRPQMLQRMIAVGVNYGERLEFGGGNIAPRPFMTPAFETLAPNFADEIVRYLDLE